MVTEKEAKEIVKLELTKAEINAIVNILEQVPVQLNSAEFLLNIRNKLKVNL